MRQRLGLGFKFSISYFAYLTLSAQDCKPVSLSNKLDWDGLQPSLDSIVQGLLTLLGPAGTQCLYVKEQVTETLKNVADAAQHTFAKVRQ